MSTRLWSSALDVFATLFCSGSGYAGQQDLVGGGGGGGEGYSPYIVLFLR